MKELISKYHLNFYFAIALHLLVFAIFAINMFELKRMHASTPSTMNAYVYQIKNHDKLPVTGVKLNQCRDVACNVSARPIDTTDHHSVPLKKPNRSIVHDIKVQQKMSAKPIAEQTAAAITNTDPVDQLLTLLHAAIAKTQQYPQQALILNQHGTVTVSFNLTVSGAISAITMVKSSGFSLLDDAGIAAVQAINPFRDAGQFIQKTQKMQVDIVFAAG